MKTIKNSIYIILLLSQIANAGSLNPLDAGADMIKQGIDSFAISIGDNMMKAGDAFATNSTSTEKHTAVNSLLFSLVTFTYDPYKNPWVMSTRDMSALIFLLLSLMYTFAGGAYVLLHNVSPSMASNIDWLRGQNFRSFYMREYLQTLLMASLIVVGGYLAVQFILQLNMALSSMVTYIVFDSIAPVTNNVVIYVMMAFNYMLLSIFMAWRTIVIGLTAAYILVLGGLYLFPSLRGIASSIFYYFCTMVFMQFILISMASGGIMIIQGIPFINGAEAIFYLALTLLLTITCFILIIGPVFFFRTAKRGLSVVRVVTL